MAHHKRKRPSNKQYMGSEWKYPQTEKGSYKRGRYSTTRWVARMNEQLREYQGRFKWYTH